jgi:hypothetical protein
MKMGLWLGMAFISYQPSLIFIFPFFLAALLFSGLRLNHYFLSVAAALLPAFAVYAFFNFFGGKSEFNFCFLAPLRMKPLMSLHIGGNLLRLETEGAHVFRVGDDKDVYFNWINSAGRQQFHVSLHNSRGPKFSDRASVERQEIGSFHIKQDIDGGGGSAARAVRRILINYNLKTRQ